jgi:hydrogenase nickel insertion protein HypA
MHEYGIVQSLVSQVDEQVRGHEGKRALRVVIAVDGEHVDEGFLRDAFDMLKVETTASAAELVVTHRPTELWCPDCDALERVAHGDSACPQCGGACVEMTSADGIYLQSVEIEV